MSDFDPSAAYWDPAEEGDILAISGIEEGVPWEAMLMWQGGHWSQVVGIAVGRAPEYFKASMADEKTGRLRSGVVTMDPVPDGMTAQIATVVEHYRADLDASQRVAMVFRDVDAWRLSPSEVPKTLGGRRFDVLRKPSGEMDEVGIAAGLYQLFVDLDRRSPTEDVAKAMGPMSRATAGRRVAEARDRGLLPPARKGTITRGVIR